jgi:hypothetical protein
MKSNAMSRWLMVWLMVVAIFVPSKVVLGHHGTAVSYEMNKHVTLKGTVTEWRFTNPHVQLYLEVKDESGKVVVWGVEGSSVYFWSQAGWTRDSLKKGDQVTVTLSPARSGASVGVMSKLVGPDGRELLFSSGRDSGAP